MYEPIQLEHKLNRITYERICEGLRNGNKICTIQPTGTGKSYLYLKFLQERQAVYQNVLFITSYNCIIDQFEKKLRKEEYGISIKNFNSVIYSNLKDREGDAFDLIILDEFHHAGSNGARKQLDILFNNNPTAKILGADATPIRYLDNEADMTCLFDGQIASEIDLFTAIKENMLLEPVYYSASYDLSDYIPEFLKLSELNQYKNSYISRLHCYIQRKLDFSDTMNYIFREIIPNQGQIYSYGRYLLFCRDVPHLKKMMNEANRKWVNHAPYPVRIYYDYSNSPSHPENDLNAFINDTEPVMRLFFSIDMVNEGFHISASDDLSSSTTTMHKSTADSSGYFLSQILFISKEIIGVFMLRTTTSGNVYYQQFGRCLSIMNREFPPLIFDLVCNYLLLTEKNRNLRDSDLSEELLLMDDDASEPTVSMSQSTLPDERTSCISSISPFPDNRNTSGISPEQPPSAVSHFPDKILSPSISEDSHHYKPDSHESLPFSSAPTVVHETPDQPVSLPIIIVSHEQPCSIPSQTNSPAVQQPSYGTQNPDLYRSQSAMSAAANSTSIHSFNSQWDTFPVYSDMTSLPSESTLVLSSPGSSASVSGINTDSSEAFPPSVPDSQRFISQTQPQSEDVSFQDSVPYTSDNTESNSSSEKVSPLPDTPGRKEILHVPDQIFSRLDDFLTQYPLTITIDQMDMIELLQLLRKHASTTYLNYECGIAVAKEYIRNGYSLYNVPEGFVYLGFPLYNWIIQMRRRKSIRHPNHLNNEQIHVLDSIGFPWYCDRIWLNNFKLAQKYYFEHGTLEMKKEWLTDENKHLPDWLAYQRQRKAGKGKPLFQLEIDLLESIGISWDGRHNLNNWFYQFERFKELYKIYGLAIPSGNTDTQPTYRWMKMQIHYMNHPEKSPLSHNQVCLLEKYIQPKDRLPAFEQKMNSLRAFIQANNRKPQKNASDPEEKRLFNFVNNQLRRKIISKMDPHKKAQFEELGYNISAFE